MLNNEESYYRIYNRIKSKHGYLDQKIGEWENYFHHQRELHDYLTECEQVIKMMEGGEHE